VARGGFSMVTELFTVVEVHEDSHRGTALRSYGPYESAAHAERERRSLHAGYVLAGTLGRRKTFVTRVERMS